MRTVGQTPEKKRAYRAANKERLAAGKKRWATANKERLAAQQREYYLANRERILAYHREYGPANRDRINAYTRARYAANPNPEYEAVRQHKRRVRITDGADLTLAEWHVVLVEFDNHCAYCQHQGLVGMDHMIPLSRGGRHTQSNVVPACTGCNSKKGSMTALEFAGQTGNSGLQSIVHSSAKLTADQIREIRSDRRSDVVVASDYGISKSSVWRIRAFKSWAWLT